MSDKTDTEREADGAADAMAVTAIIGVIVLTVCIWLSGMPT
ncbi:MAG: methionine synthase [Gammaproteobacteria bacterium]|nr:methionine synthase [Gammaproteobacteria bacterium]MDH5170820.1 methionine synthase [Gammaproteobacteria bacterium]